MKIIKDNTALPEGVAIALGAFDGVHTGHKKLVENIVSYAKNNNCSSLVYTFDVLPSGARYITDFEQRIRIFESLGVDYLYIQRFDADFKKMSAQAFLQSFIKGAKYVTVGFNFRFGNGREGNTKVLEEYCRENNIHIDIVPPVYLDDEIVSSTKIRGYIEENNFKMAKQMLGYDFSVSGVVVHGNALGRTIGFPTANICVDENRIMPLEGVFATLTEYDGEFYPSISNYGGKPTFKDNKILLETNIFDFDGDLYGKKIVVHFIEKLRDIVAFESVDALKSQLIADKNKTLKIFQKTIYK